MDRAQAEVEARWSRHWDRGRGCSWSRERHGCRVVLYGLTDESVYRDALDNAEDITIAVRRVEPAARVRQFTVIRDDGNRAIVIVVRVAADDLAVFEGGPMHRKAICRAYACASARMRSVA